MAVGALLSGNETGFRSTTSLPEHVHTDAGFEDYPKTVAFLNLLHLYYTPIVILLGLIGNVLSFIAFVCTHLRRRCSSYYLAALAVSDFTYLCLMFFTWAEKLGYKMSNTSLRCSLLVFLNSTFSSWSVWLTVSFTAERFLAVSYPLWRLQLSTRRRARGAVLLTFLLSSLLNVYIFWVVDANSDVQECQPKPEYEILFHYMNIMDTVVTLILPFLLIAFMNFRIGRVLYRFYARHKLCRTDSLQAVNSSSQQPLERINFEMQDNVWFWNNCIPHLAIWLLCKYLCRSISVCPFADYLYVALPISTLAHLTLIAHSSVPAPSHAQLCNSTNPVTEQLLDILTQQNNNYSTVNNNPVFPQANQIGISRMLFLVCTVFIILNLPSYVTRMYLFVITLSDDTADISPLVLLLHKYFMLLYYTNFAINFLLYNISSRVFRRTLKTYLKKRGHLLREMFITLHSGGGLESGAGFSTQERLQTPYRNKVGVDVVLNQSRVISRLRPIRLQTQRCVEHVQSSSHEEGCGSIKTFGICTNIPSKESDLVSVF